MEIKLLSNKLLTFEKIKRVENKFNETRKEKLKQKIIMLLTFCSHFCCCYFDDDRLLYDVKFFETRCFVCLIAKDDDFCQLLWIREIKDKRFFVFTCVHFDDLYCIRFRRNTWDYAAINYTVLSLFQFFFSFILFPFVDVKLIEFQEEGKKKTPESKTKMFGIRHIYLLLFVNGLRNFCFHLLHSIIISISLTAADEATVLSLLFDNNFLATC